MELALPISVHYPLDVFHKFHYFYVVHAYLFFAIQIYLLRRFEVSFIVQMAVEFSRLPHNRQKPLPLFSGMNLNGVKVRYTLWHVPLYLLLREQILSSAFKSAKAFVKLIVERSEL